MAKGKTGKQRRDAQNPEFESTEDADWECDRHMAAPEQKIENERSGMLDGGDFSSLGALFGDVKRRVRSMMLRGPALDLEGQRGRKDNAFFQVGIRHNIQYTILHSPQGLE